MNELHCIALVWLTLFGALFGAMFFAAGAVLAAEPAQVNFGKPDNVLDIKPFLSPYRAPGGGTESDGSSWYIVQVSNDTVRPAARVLLAGQPPLAPLSLLPRKYRPSILAVAISDSRTVVDNRSAYRLRT